MNPGPAPFPWKAALQAGLCWMRLDPKTFWAMTPIELAIATGMHREAGGGVLERRALEALMARFPDRGFGRGNSDDAGGSGEAG